MSPKSPHSRFPPGGVCSSAEGVNSESDRRAREWVSVLDFEVINMIGRIIRNGSRGSYEFCELDPLSAGEAIDRCVDYNLLIWIKVVQKVKQRLEAQPSFVAQRNLDALCFRIFEAVALRGHRLLQTELEREVSRRKEAYRQSRQAERADVCVESSAYERGGELM